MKRREFVKNIGLLSISSSLLPACDFSGDQAIDESLKLLQSFSLSEFKDEQEEYPQLVSNDNGEAWLFSLRRLPFPENKELISSFFYDGQSWIEQNPVSPDSGQYEFPTASCAPDGQPVVAWCNKKNDDWSIMVALQENGQFNSPKTFRAASGRFITPVLISPAKERNWIAWECFDQGLFSIFLCKGENGNWGTPIQISEPGKSLFDPALAEGKDGHLYLAYGITDGVHQNIEMKIVDSASLEVQKTVPIAIGGGLSERVNLNTKPALAFDKNNRLWISWENNRKTSRLEDGDNFTGDRICAVVAYENGQIMEPGNRKWLFNEKNDHLPTFVRDKENNLYLITHCGGDFDGNPFWKFRLSCLDVNKGWTEPKTIFETAQKGQTSRPSMFFENQDKFWLAVCPEKWFNDFEEEAQHEKEPVRVRVSKLELHQFKTAEVNLGNTTLQLKKAVVEEHHPTENFFPPLSGRPRIPRKTVNYKGTTYTLLLGNLHEHSEISSCWPAGCDGTLHDDYRFGLYSEGYDFAGVTDHGYSLNEVYWRKSLRLAAFYNDPNFFIALPAMEWTLSNGRGNVEIKKGVGHKNVIFPSTEEALKFIRNKHEVYSVKTPEMADAVKLWQYLHDHKIDCVTIPHHPADEVHPTDWEVHDPHYEPIVEIFQCRGNAEYPGCPREINVERHKPIPNENAFIDYALREKQYKFGFIASGDHNGIGVGLAAVWVKEINRAGILDALKNRRTFATTGDKIFVDFRVNGIWGGEVAQVKNASPELTFNVEAVQPIKSLEILRNSKVIKTILPEGKLLNYDGSFVDEEYQAEEEVLYYYLRVIQDNDHIGWSSPVWVSEKRIF